MIVSWLFASLSSMLLPVWIGRRLFSLWLTEKPRVYELYTAATGLYLCLVAVKASTFVSAWLRQGWVQMAEKIKEWTAKASVFKNMKVIVYHNEWPYFEQRFGIIIADFLEPKPGIPPTPSQLAKVIGEMKRDNIKIIINSPYFTSDAADLVARNAGGKVVTLATSVGANDKVKTYIDLFDYDVALLAAAVQ